MALTLFVPPKDTYSIILFLLKFECNVHNTLEVKNSGISYHMCPK